MSWENLLMLFANNKGPDQPAHPRSLISTFVVRCLDSIIPLVYISAILSLYLASEAEQTGLSLTWLQTWRQVLSWHCEWSWLRTNGTLPQSRKEHTGLDSHHSTLSVSRCPLSDKLSDHDIISGTMNIFIPPIKKPRRKVYLHQKGDYESIRKDTLEFAREKYFNGHSDTRSVQENFDLLTSFIHDSRDKHIPLKTSRSVSSIPWITPEIRRKICRKNKTHAKAKKTGSSKLRSKFETLRREIKADIRKQHDLYVNNLVGDVKANPRDFYRYINSQKKDTQGITALKSKNGKGVAQSDL